MTDLTQKQCVPCSGIGTPMAMKEAQTMLAQTPGWELDGSGTRIERRLRMKNFSEAVDLITKIAAIAEQEDHHPDLHLTNYRDLTIALSTHAVKGLSENDFILAAKINVLPMKLKEAPHA